MARERSYGQFCPVSKAAQLFCERWTPLIIRDLGAGASRFSELQRGVPLMSPSLLSRRLKQLEKEGILERRKATRGHSYHLTPAGEEFVPVVMALGTWGQRWARRELEDDELNLDLLLFAMELGVRPQALPAGIQVVQIDFTDQPARKSRFWFVNEDGQVALCLEEPRQETDLTIVTDLRTLTAVWTGDLSLTRGLDSGALAVHGSSAMRRLLRPWLGLSPFAAVKPARDGPAAGALTD